MVFDASNVTLDCAGYQVHISSFTKGRGPDREKVGVYALGKSHIEIKNCRIVGDFDAGLWVEGGSNLKVSDVYSSTGTGNSFLARLAPGVIAYSGVALTIRN